MAFGISRKELLIWKEKVSNGEIAFLTHYWMDERFPECKTVTKVGCSDIKKLILWGEKYLLRPEWIHHQEGFPHYDLLGEKQKQIMEEENMSWQLEKLKY